MEARIDPYGEDVRLKWFERPWTGRAMGAAMLAFAMTTGAGGTAVWRDTLLVVGAGLLCGVLVWRFDAWWGRRAPVRMVGRRGTEFARRVPTAVLATAIYAGGIVLLSTAYVFPFLFSILAADFALITPGLRRRDAARRILKEIPARPDAVPPPSASQT